MPRYDYIAVYFGTKMPIIKLIAEKLKSKPGEILRTICYQKLNIPFDKELFKRINQYIKGDKQCQKEKQ